MMLILSILIFRLNIWMVELKDVVKTLDRYIYAHRWMY